MSTHTSPTPAAVAGQVQVMESVASADLGVQQRKSYRRKYRKIMVKFEERMRESNGLFRDEQRIYDISQRLAEQTDQLLQMFLELNDRPQIPARMRYDLRPPTEVNAKDESQQRRHDISALEELRLARNRVQRGEITISDSLDVQRNMLRCSEFVPVKSYTKMMNAAELTNLRQLSTEIHQPTASVLSIKQELQYLQSLDDFLEGKATVARNHTSKSLGSRTAEKTTDRERETQLRNPVSVYNWLRKHQPQVFLQDHEAGSGDKAAKSAGSRSSKRTAVKEVKQEPEYYDEDGIAVESTASARGKRKRDEDTAFRPKGGRSGHPAKRRKDEISGKRSKRSSMDARNM